jgi:hypothetical protein
VVVEAELDYTSGFPGMTIVGLPDAPSRKAANGLKRLVDILGRAGLPVGISWHIVEKSGFPVPALRKCLDNAGNQPQMALIT